MRLATDEGRDFMREGRRGKEKGRRCAARGERGRLCW
jgi:hypothetical protein